VDTLYEDVSELGENQSCQSGLNFGLPAKFGWEWVAVVSEQLPHNNLTCSTVCWEANQEKTKKKLKIENLKFYLVDRAFSCPSQVLNIIHTNQHSTIPVNG
jgi:hypothetical protein